MARCHRHSDHQVRQGGGIEEDIHPVIIPNVEGESVEKGSYFSVSDGDRCLESDVSIQRRAGLEGVARRELLIVSFDVDVGEVGHHQQVVGRQDKKAGLVEAGDLDLYTRL